MTRLRRRALLSFLVLGGCCAAIVGAVAASTSTAVAAGTCSIYWTGASSTAWTSGSNWSLSDGGAASGTTPSATDFACMSTAPTRSAVVMASGNRTVAGIRFLVTPTVTPSLTVQGGTFTVNTNDSAINNLTETGALAGSATVTLTGTTSWNSMAVYGGAKTVPTGSTLNVTSSLTLGNGTAATPGTLTVNGTLAATNVSISLATAPAAGTATTLTLAGASSFSGSSVGTSGSAALKPKLVSTGAMTVSSSGSTTVDVPFSNNGSVALTSGALVLYQGGTSAAADTGSYALAASTELNFAGGTRSIAPGTVTGSGQVAVAGGIVTFAPGTTIPLLRLSGSGTVSGTLSVGVLTTQDGILDGAGTMTVTGSGSTLAGLTVAHGYRLLNQGSMSFNDSYDYVVVNSGGIVENAGTFMMTGTYPITANDTSTASAVLNDAGATWNVTLSSVGSSAYVDVPFTNNGTVNVTKGQLILTRGNAGTGTDGGTYVLSSGTTLNFAGGTRTINTGTISGSGTVNVSGGTTAFGTGVTLPTLALNGGTISGSPTVSTFLGNTGTLTGAGTMTVTGTGSTLCGLSINGGYRLLNQGSMTHDLDCDYVYMRGSSTFENAGTLTFTSTRGYNYPIYDADSNNPSTMINDAGATLAIALGNTAYNATINTIFTNNGTVNVTSGALVLTNNGVDGGTYVLSSGTTLNFAGGTRTINTGTISGSGTVNVSGGTTAFGTGVTLPTLALNGGTISGSPTVSTFLGNTGTLTGAGTMTVTGTGSTLCGLSINGGYRLLNQGSMTHDLDCDYVYMRGSSTFENAGTLTFTSTRGYNYPIYDADSNNPSTMINDAGATLAIALGNTAYNATINTIFTNNGTVNVTSGALVLTNNGVDGGTYVLSSGTTLNFAGGTRTINTGTISGSGTVNVSGGTTAFGTGVTLPTLALNGGTISGSPTVSTFLGNTGTLTGAGTMTVTGTGSTLCGLSINGGYRLLNQGSMTHDLDCDYVYMRGSSTFENAGTLTFTSTRGYNYPIYDADSNNPSTMINDAGATLAIALGNTAYNATINTIFTNNGTVNATKGVLTFSSVTNLSAGGVLLTGTWNVATSGGIRLPRTITSNAATVSVTGSGALTAQSTGAAALTTLATNSGSLTIGQNLNIAAGLSNTGSVTITAGTLRPSTYTQTAGTTTIRSGAGLRGGSSGTGGIVINGGALTGSGAVQGALSGAGTIVPGTAGSGTLTVSGPYTATAGSTLAVTAGATATSLTGTGAASLAGTLAITTVGPPPAIGTSATVLSAATLSGTFGTVTGVDVPAANAYWAVGYSSTAVTLTLTAYPQVSIGAVSTPEGNSGTTTLSFPVTLSAPSAVTATVAYTTSDGTATAPGDFAPASGTVTFAPGVTSRAVTVTVNGDTLYESDETVVVTLSAPVGTTLGTATANGTVVNDDAAPAVSIADAGGSIDSNGGTTITFPVTLSTVSGLPATVGYATADGTAAAPADYTATSGTLTIPAGSTTGQIQVTVPAQPGYAPPATFTVTLTNPVNATLGTSTATGTITNTNQTGTNPVVTSVSPSLSAQGTTLQVVVSGSDFAPGAGVVVSGPGVTVSAVNVVNSARITATFTVAANAVVAARDVTVTVPNASPATCAGCFTVTAKPSISTPSRTAFAQGNVDVVFSASGTGFGPGTAVTLVRGARVVEATSVSVASATSLTAVVSLAANATLGAYSVVATNPDGGVGTCTNCVTVYVAPKITAVSSSSVARGASQTMTFTGSGFVAGSLVSVANCTLSNVQVVNATTITATVTPTRTATAGTKTVKVINPATAGGGTGQKVAAVTVT